VRPFDVFFNRPLAILAEIDAAGATIPCLSNLRGGATRVAGSGSAGSSKGWKAVASDPPARRSQSRTSRRARGSVLTRSLPFSPRESSKSVSFGATAGRWGVSSGAPVRVPTGRELGLTWRDQPKWAEFRAETAHGAWSPGPQDSRRQAVAKGASVRHRFQYVGPAGCRTSTPREQSQTAYVEDHRRLKPQRTSCAMTSARHAGEVTAS